MSDTTTTRRRPLRKRAPVPMREMLVGAGPDRAPAPTEPFITTYSGQAVSRSSGVPTLEDIAYALAWQPRFAGHTRRWYSVLDHSLFCGALAARLAGPGVYDLNGELRASFMKAVLLHDAHEAITGDVPTPFKPSELHLMQGALDRRIYHAYAPGSSWPHNIRTIDLRALRAEALVIGPPKYRHLDAVACDFGDVPDPQDVVLLQDLLEHGELGVLPTADRSQHPAVQTFLQTMREL